MGTLNEDLSAIKEVEDKIVVNKVARFAYTDEAYTTNDANGVAEYNVNNDQNIPTADASVLKVNETVLSKGYRAQASSVTRMLLNHFFGRMSYNLNKVNDIVSNLITTLIGHRGTANGFATLDENGRIPYSQLPESAMEYKGQWNAETNTPTLADGTGTKGDFYIVSVGGTQNLGSGNIQFSANDRIIYDGSVWARLSAGAVQTVNNISPENGNIALTGENIPVSSTDPTLLSAPLTTDRYADSSITNAKIKGSISVDKGGTGATDAANGFMNLANGLTQGQNPQDAEYMIYKSETNWGLYTLSTFWDYTKGKISSVLGLTATNYSGTADKATNDGNGNNIVNTYATKTALDNKANVDNTNYKTTKVFYGNKNGRYVKIGSIPVSSGNVSYATLSIEVFGKSPVANFPVGNIILNMSSGSYSNGFNINGYSSIPLNNTDNTDYSHIIVEKTSTDYILYVVSTYSFLSITVTEGHSSRYTRGNFEEVSTLSGTVVYDSTVDNQIILVNGNATNAYNAYSGMVHTCSTASSTKEKTVSVPGFTLTQGACIKVFFENGNSAVEPTLNVNGTGAIPIYTNKRGNLNFIVKDWDAGISMTLMFEGNGFVVLGNPIVKLELNLVTAGTGAMRNFIRYASGLLIQWGTVIANGLTQQTIEAYTGNSSYSLLATPSDGATGWIKCLRFDKKTIKLGIETVSGGYTDGTVSWLTIGW